MSEIDELADQLKETHDMALRKEAWRRVAAEAIRILTAKYRPIVEALAQEDTTP